METEEQGTTEELIDTYERRRKNKADDIIAAQAVLCIFIAALFIFGRIFYPEVTGEVYHKLTALITDKDFVLENPIELLERLLDKR
ncbi:hypothetical protein [Ruminococcus flavefaciens]|uniref:hypothetical protein n=1 Tax=Ruminococcus flavefaciens TaxID=1265 RepID=UPI0026F136D4|nr:hypothetical protein [Ruminococcus flavefaciens]MDD7515596.1 hypothetical protein [Ruminococcus flavefaciens]MDY5692745.1 hypothetical protein [Ruminococcus flavefaciens]